MIFYEIKNRNEHNSFRHGAGDGNRTHVASLEGWNSTIELHPHSGAVDEIRTRDIHLGKVALYH